MADELRLPGEGKLPDTSGVRLASDEKQDGSPVVPAAGTTLSERLAAATTQGGLSSLPAGFDDPQGDWKTLLSDNPFEQLYLDYRLPGFISPELVQRQAALLEKFWNTKILLLNTGANRTVFKSKYGEGTIEGSVGRIRKAAEKIGTTAGIQQYHAEINTRRLHKGEEGLRDSIEHMMIDGCADKMEIELCLERGLRHALTADESAAIIRKNLDAGLFKAYGKVSGNTELERLLSVDAWMTEARIAEAEALRKERESVQIQILPGKYARTMEEIGRILYDDPGEAKEIIKDDLLKQVVAQKDMVLAREISALSRKPDLDAAYLAIVYKLNPALPYRFGQQQLDSVENLCSAIAATEETLKLGKDHLHRGFIESWLRETNRPAYDEFLRIRDSAPNVELALFEFLYCFNANLPYRLESRQVVQTIPELCRAILVNEQSWQAGRKALFGGVLSVWMRTAKHSRIPDQWDKVKANFEDRQDLGLEYFLHLLQPELEHAVLQVDPQAVVFPPLPSNKPAAFKLVFSNMTRGQLEARLAFTQEIPGLQLSNQEIVLNPQTGKTTATVEIRVDPATMRKGVLYETVLVATGFEQQQVHIPVKFRVVFPKKAFTIELIKYAAITAIFFAAIRGMIGGQYPGWLNESFQSFQSEMGVRNMTSLFALFGWSFLLLLAGLGYGIYLLIKYVLRK